MALKIEERHYQIEFVEDVLGSSPADDDVWTRWVASRAPAPWVQEDEKQSREDILEKSIGLTVFPRTKEGLHLFNYHILGFLKEAAAACNKLLFSRKKKKGGAEEVAGIWNIRSKIDSYVFVNPRRLYLMRNGKSILEEDEILERPLRAETLRGPRITLVASEVVKAPVKINFSIQLLANPEVSFSQIEELLNYGELKGLGQWRNGSWGRFKWRSAEA